MNPLEAPQPPPSRRWRAALRPVLVAALMGACGLGLGYLLGKSAVTLPWLRTRLDALSAVDLLVLPLLILLVLAVHELGHLLGGMSRGMRFLLLIVGPMQWVRSAEGVSFKWHRNVGLMGGLAAATPDPDRPLHPQLERLIVGGPLASLLLAAAAIGLSTVLDGRPGAYAAIVGFFSATIFLATATPLQAGGFMSDGMQLLELRRGGSAVTDRQLLMRLMSLSQAGTRPRDWDPELVRQALSLGESVPLRRIAGRLFAFYHALDRGDAQDVAMHAAWLAGQLDGYPQGFRQSITLELCLVAAQAGDLAAAREWWQRSRGGVADAARRALSEASLAALEGDDARVRRSIAAGRKALSRGMDPGINVLTADQLDGLERRLHEPRGAGPASRSGPVEPAG